MKALLKKDQNHIKKAKEEAEKAIENLMSLLEDAENKVADYASQRSDSWYDTDAGDAHTDWENFIEAKRYQFADALEELKAISVEVIFNRDTPSADESIYQLSKKLEKNRKSISELLEEQKTLNDKIMAKSA